MLGPYTTPHTVITACLYDAGVNSSIETWHALSIMAASNERIPATGKSYQPVPISVVHRIHVISIPVAFHNYRK